MNSAMISLDSNQSSIYFDANDEHVAKLKAGMSVYATIDTGHERTLAGLLGLGATTDQGKD